MSSKESLDNLVLESIASLFNAKLGNFTFLATLPNLPENEKDLAHLLDVIPVGEPLKREGSLENYFSQVYGEILNAQKEKPLAVQIGLEHYKDRSNWLKPFTVPKYTPDLQTIESAMSKSNTRSTSVNSTQQLISIPPYPTFPEMVANSALVSCFQEMAKAPFITSVGFSRSCSLPITAGSWFFSGAFVYAYQTPDNWNSSVISWDDVFNPQHGILKDLNTDISVVSDMTVELHSKGSFNSSMAKALGSIPNQVLFPFYQQIDSASTSFKLNADRSLTITLEVPKSANGYVFGMQYEKVTSRIG